MEPVQHMCGFLLERTVWMHIPTYFVLATPSDEATRLEEVWACPQCGESLCDTDMLMHGAPLYMPFPSTWSIERRKARGWPVGEIAV